MTAVCSKCGRIITLNPAVYELWRRRGPILPNTHFPSESLKRHKCDHGVWCSSCLQTHKDWSKK